jgi:hypothetical protein
MGHTRDRENLTRRSRRLVGENAERADIEAGIFTGQFASGDQRDGLSLDKSEIARKERPRIGALTIIGRATERSPAKLEIAGVLEKEVARLGKEKREPRRVHLPLVERGVGEIRVECECAGQRRGDAIKDIPAAGSAQPGAVVKNAPVML